MHGGKDVEILLAAVTWIWNAFCPETEEIGSDVTIKTSWDLSACGALVTPNGKIPLTVGYGKWLRGPALSLGGPSPAAS